MAVSRPVLISRLLGGEMGITWNWTGTTLQIEPLYFSCGGTAHLLTPDLSRPPGFWSGLPFMHCLFSLEFFFVIFKKESVKLSVLAIIRKNIGIISTWPQSTMTYKPITVKCKIVSVFQDSQLWFILVGAGNLKAQMYDH